MLGKNIAKYRKQKKISQSALGEMFNVTQGAVSQWERGVTAPDIPTIKEIAKVLGVSFSDLVGDDTWGTMQPEHPLPFDIQPYASWPEDRPETRAIIERILAKLAMLDAEGQKIAEEHIDFVLSRQNKE